MEEIRYEYETGFYLGRFQPFHIGHKSVIDTMLLRCRHIVIGLGSSQMTASVDRNPLSWELRAAMIEYVYSHNKDRFTFIPIKDRDILCNDSSWGKYLLDQYKGYFNGKVPDVIFEGEEFERNNWYNHIDIPIEKISRYEMPVSGSLIRKLMKKDHDETAKTYIPKALYNYYYEIKEIIKEKW